MRNLTREMSRYTRLSIFVACMIGLGILAGPTMGQSRTVTSTSANGAGSAKPFVHNFSSLTTASLYAAQNQDPSQAVAPPSAAPPAASPAIPVAKKVELPEGDGKPIATEYCQDCHRLTTVVSVHKTSDEWLDSVHLMVDRGARIPDDKVDALVQYLTKNFGPLVAAPAPAPAAQSAQPIPAPPAAFPTIPPAKKTELPEGDGKPIATEYCQDCHRLTNLTTAHKAPDEWLDTVHLMMDRGARIPDDKVDALVQYLAKNFGPLAAAVPAPANAPSGNASPAPAAQSK